MDKHMLSELYLHRCMSMQEIASSLHISVNKVNYWLKKHSIATRSYSDASYVKYNGTTDPFIIKVGLTLAEENLKGLGIGIYWGEGNKKSLNAVRVGNTDPHLLKTFIKFLVAICGVSKDKVRFGLQLFNDVSETDALIFWQNQLKIKRNQIMPTVSRIKSGKIGTYKVKNQFGVMTVYVFNRKLRDWLVNQLVVPQ